jgi:Immunity protein 22
MKAERVHVFASNEGRFASWDDLRAYVLETYTEDGDGIPSAFARETQQAAYEPASVECYWSERTVPLAQLMRGASYGDQWLASTPNAMANAVICVFEPFNVLRAPEASSLTYLGAFPFVAPEYTRS